MKIHMNKAATHQMSHAYLDRRLDTKNQILIQKVGSKWPDSSELEQEGLTLVSLVFPCLSNGQVGCLFSLLARALK